MVLSALAADVAGPHLSARRLGAPMAFGRPWDRPGVGEILAGLLGEHPFEFLLERAVFISVLHCLFVARTDRAWEQWMADCKIPGIEDL